MLDTTTPATSVNCNPRLQFELFVVYLKLSAWLKFLPELSIKEFELFHWQTLLDQMLKPQTEETCQLLHSLVPINPN